MEEVSTFASEFCCLLLTYSDVFHIPTVSRLWEPLAYPLLFPHGSLGWGLVGRTDDVADANQPLGANAAPDFELATTQMWHYRYYLLHEERFQIFGCLTNEYLVDMFSCNLKTRLAYIRHNQEHIK